MKFNPEGTALVVIDPRNDVLSEKGIRWSPVRESVKANKMVASPQRAWGPQANHIILQREKREVNKVTLAGTLANLCLKTLFITV